MKYSISALVLTLMAAQSAHAATTALEAIETKRTSVQQRADRNYYRSSTFKDVRAIVDEKGFAQVGTSQYGQNATTYDNGNVAGTPGQIGGGATTSPAQKAYQEALTKLNIEFNTRASNDQRAIDNYRAELEQSAGHGMAELQTRLNQYLEAQKVLQEEARINYQNQIAALGNNATDSSLTALRVAYAANYAQASSVYSAVIKNLKDQYESSLANYKNQLAAFSNNLNAQRQADYSNALAGLPNPN